MSTRLRRFAIWWFVIGFALVGVFGRFPWKADEPYSFGIVHRILADHAWVVPHIADIAFVEKPPLVYWIGALSAKALPHLPEHESSRVAVVLLVALAFASIHASARWLWPEARRWWAWSKEAGGPFPMAMNAGALTQPGAPRGRYAITALLLVAGTLGFMEQLHKLTADIGQLAGSSLALSGLVRLGARDRSADPRAHWTVGLLVGTGVGIGFMSKGLLVPGWVGLTWLLASPMPGYRSALAARAAAVACLAALPWLLTWPLLLLARSPDLFHEWFWVQNVGRFFGTARLGGNDVTLLDRAQSLLFIAFPVCLGIVAVGVRTWGARRRTTSLDWSALRDAPGHAFVAVFAATALTTLLASGSYRDNYVLPVLPALVLLALPATLGRASRLIGLVSSAIDAVFAVLIVTVVALWWQLVARGVVWPHSLAAAVGRTLPVPFDLPFQPAAALTAVVTIAIWGFIQRSGLRNALVTWSINMAVLWIVVFTLLLPWVDAARSYREVFTELRESHSPTTCVATFNLGESELAMFEYVTGFEARRAVFMSPEGPPVPVPNPTADACNWRLVLSNETVSEITPDPRFWTPVWRGHRPADAHERFVLFRRRPQ